jgi:hypothetical protein
MIENMETVVCEYGAGFHIKFIEEAIIYVFRAYTDPVLERSEYHEFYFKMVYYYDLLSLVLWAYTAKPKVFKEYSKFAIPVHAKDIKLKALNKYEDRKEELEDISPPTDSELATSGVINLLKSSINRTSNIWIPLEFREQFNKTLQESLAFFIGKKKRSKTITKVSAMLLPVGHFIGRFPRIYNPNMQEFVDDPTYSQSDIQYVENDIIVGYNEKSQTGTHIRFKLREPLTRIKKYKDSRKIMRGVVCKSKSKPELYALAKKLDIPIPEKHVNTDELCMFIKTKLIRLELTERIKKSKIKWFYNHYEQQPKN